MKDSQNGKNRKREHYKENLKQNEGRESSKQTLIFSGILAGLGVLILIVILPVYFTNKSVPIVTTPTHALPKTTYSSQTNPTSATEQTVIATTINPPVYPSNGRIDCIPDKSPSELECRNRGCIWSPSFEDASAPSCFFGSSKAYGHQETTSDQRGIYSVLSLKQSNSFNHFGTNFDQINVETTYISRTTLRIKIFPAVQRYKVPLKDPIGIGKPISSLYNVQHSTQNDVFGAKVSRKTTGSTIFDSSFGVMIFSDQFLQISTRIASKFVYGFGEHAHSTLKRNMNWERWGMFSSTGERKIGQNLNGVHPYFICMEEGGNAYGVFFVNSNVMDIELQPTPAVTYRSTGGVMDFYVFLGPTPDEVTKQYTQVAGKPFMPPYWSLGFHLSRKGYGSLQNLTNVVARNLDNGLPYDAQHVDTDYMERGVGFTVDNARFQGLGTYLSNLKSQNKIRSIIAAHPTISANESHSYVPFEKGSEYNVFIRTANGADTLRTKSWSLLPGVTANSATAKEEERAHVVLPDFFHPNATAWWTETIGNFHQEIQYDGLWIDMNEPSSFINGSVKGCDESKLDNPPYLPKLNGESLLDRTICMSSQHYPNLDHYNVHSLYGWSQSATTLNACRQITGERCVILSTSTYTGSGAYSGHRIGDTTSSWEDLQNSIIGMLEFNIFGIPFVGADVCGYYGDATYELCVRWMQLGAFYPFYNNHNSEGSSDQDPAYFGNGFVSDVTEAMLARYSLLPYLYTLFYDSHRQGSAVARPLFYEFPDDNQTYNINHQFMWGKRVLVTPVVEQNAKLVSGYFPYSRWYDFYSGEELSVKGSKAELQAPLNHINLHIKGGSIITTQNPASTTFHSRRQHLVLVVALDENGIAEGRVFWDDGVSVDTVNEYQYTEVEFSCEKQLLRSTVLHSHETAGNLTFSKIKILGVEESVTRVRIDDRDVEYNLETAVSSVIVENLTLRLIEEFELKWEYDDEWSRIDCMPSKTERPNRISCQQRGCTWNPAVRSLNVPSCFYTLDETGLFTSPSYSATVVQINENSSRYNLTINEGSRAIYGTPEKELKVAIEYQTDRTLHIKITDAEGQSYEIPNEIQNISRPSTSGKTNSAYEVFVNENPFYIRVVRKSTGKLIFDSSVGPIIFEERFLQISTSLPSENVFGFGEHNHKRYRHDLNWRRWGIFSRDWLPVGPFNLYGHQTFFMAIDDSDNGTAIGVYFHNSNAMDVVLQPRPSVTYRTTGGILDFYIFVADSQEELVSEYQKLVGLPMMPPYWGLGFQLSRWGYGSLERVKEVVNEMRSAEIPYDVQYGDIDYMDSSKDFTYDETNYQGLPEFVDQLHEWGMKYVIILDPAIKIEDGYEPYDRGIRDGVFVMNANGVSPAVSRVWPGLTHHADFTNPNTSIWWLDECKSFHDTTGIKYDALWVDMNEPSSFLNAFPLDFFGTNCSTEVNKPPYMPRILWYRTGLHSRTLCMENQQHLGQHYNLHSLYGHTMAKTTHRTLESIFPNKRSFVITRSTFGGTGHYAGHWLGDNQSLWPPMSWAITGMFEFNLFGVPYVGADICGFMLDAGSELCERWMQVGAFYPFSRNHNANGRKPQHPTAYGKNVTASCKRVLEIRYSILPYFYTQHQRVHEHGGTVIRALVHEFPKARNTWNIHKQFLIGKGFLITPVLEAGARTVTGYFPSESRWFDFYTGQELESTGFHRTLDAPIDHINLHTRGGVIIPMQEPAVTTVLSRQNPMSLLVALDHIQNSYGELYWDNGEKRNVGDGFLRIQFNCSQSILSFNILHPPTDFETDLHFNRVTLLGVAADDITSVLFNRNSSVIDSKMEEKAEFEFTSNKILSIFNLQLRIDQPHIIRWET